MLTSYTGVNNQHVTHLLNHSRQRSPTWELCNDSTFSLQCYIEKKNYAVAATWLKKANDLPSVTADVSVISMLFNALQSPIFIQSSQFFSEHPLMDYPAQVKNKQFAYLRWPPWANLHIQYRHKRSSVVTAFCSKLSIVEGGDFHICYVNIRSS